MNAVAAAIVAEAVVVTTIFAGAIAKIHGHTAWAVIVGWFL